MSSTPETVLKEILDDYLSRAGHSLRSFSRESGVGQSLLSKILAGKIKLTVRQAKRILANVPLSDEHTRKLESAFFSVKSAPSGAPVSASDFDEVKSQGSAVTWLDLAVMDYFTVSSSVQEVEAISRRFRVSVNQVYEAIERLEKLKLIRLEGEAYVKTRREIVFQSEADHESIRAIHRDLLNRGMDQLRDGSTSATRRRYLTSYTAAIDPAKLPEARKKIDAFQTELLRFLGSKQKTAVVYAWNSILFPLEG